MKSRLQSDLPPIVELRSLQAFVAVSECGSVTHAARRLGLTQSAISQSLRQLERQLHVSLFERDCRPLQLTAAGALLRDRAPRLLEQARQLPTVLQEISCAKLPDVRVGLVDSFAATVGPHLIRVLLQSTLHLTVYGGLSPAHSEGLQRRLVDLVVTSDPLYDLDGLERHAIVREPFFIIASADIANRLKGLSLDEIAARHALVRYSARSHIGMQIERHLRRVGVHSPKSVEVDTSDTLVAMVAAGCGFAITTPLCYLQGRAHAAATVPLSLPGAGFSRSLWLIAHAGAYAALPQCVAAQAGRMLTTFILPEMRKLTPAFMDEIVVGEATPPRLAKTGSCC